MMKDKFDKILSNKIKDTFKNREVSYNPEHWEMLITEKGKKKKRILFFWRFAGTALLFIVAGSLGKFLFSNSETIQSKEIEIEIVEDDKNSSKKDIINKTYDSIKAKDDLRISEIDTTDSRGKTFRKINQIKLNTKAIATSKNNTNIDSKHKNASEIAYKVIPQKDSLKRNTSDNNIFEFPIDNNITQNHIEIDTIKNKKSIPKNKKDIEKLITKNNIEELRKKTIKKAIKIGVNLSSMVNSIKENQNSDIGFSSGITVEIPVLKKFDISTGILYTDQKFDLHNQNISSLADAVSNDGIQLTSKEATVRGIEIPINIKYNFSISERKLFVSAGFSSTSYFKESITEKYLVNTKTASNTLNSSGDEIIQYSIIQSNKTLEIKQNPTDSFNFASMLNLSFGMEFPMNNRQSIVVEPYFKYSLKPVTHQEVDFTNAGLYLRYNFSLKKE